MIRPLWKIFLNIVDGEKDSEKTCDECFLIMEYFADQAVYGVDNEKLLESARKHLAKCPECREHHLKRLREMEKRYRKDHQTGNK